ncbi:hypothetical protein HDU88_000491 [Geranomyces variabilis]|nr:hypothetical protein HDU88_000491 [Geranomyces variabilis]
MASKFEKYCGRADEFQAIKARLLELKERAATLGVHQAQVATTAKIVDSVFSKKRPAQTGEAKSKKPKASKPERVLNNNDKPTSSACPANSSDEGGSDDVTAAADAKPDAQDLHACLSMMRKMLPTPKGLQGSNTTASSTTVALAIKGKSTSSAYPAQSSDEADSDDVTAAADARSDAQNLHACLTMMRKMSPTPKGVYLIRLGTYSQWTKVGDPPKIFTGTVHCAMAVRGSPTFLHKELKESMATANKGKATDVVFKWGRTIDFMDRFTKHKADFGAIINAKPMLVKTIHIEDGKGAARTGRTLAAWCRRRQRRHGGRAHAGPCGRRRV